MQRQEGERNANGTNVVVLIVSPLTRRHHEEMEEIRIPSIVLSTKDDVLLLMGDRDTSLFSVQRKTFGYKIPKHVEEQRFSAT